jgi:2-polyprenyl-6-methoxyphenol hydroxylase-like FAD-dependent oxidoreductase
MPFGDTAGRQPALRESPAPGRCTNPQGGAPALRPRRAWRPALQTNRAERPSPQGYDAPGVLDVPIVGGWVVHPSCCAAARLQNCGMANVPVIVGAGPVGLGAALVLRQAGIAVRIVDMAPEPSHYSKALAVNPRTLELLEPTGVTARMLSLGIRIRSARFQNDNKWSGELTLGGLKHKYPFMLALSQATTEHLLTQALEDAGGKVERGVALESCSNKSDDTVEVELKHVAGGAIEEVECPWLLAADGAHSTARNALEINFGGSSFEKPWHLADIVLHTALEEDHAYVFFLEGGFLFLIRVVDETNRESQGPGLWRVISNKPELMNRIPHSTAAGPPVWSSEFHISHRINDTLQKGNVYFAGDAAHIHSPMGARGMNLGLEDAWVFSRLVQSGQMKRYGELRRSVDEAVVKRIERLSRIVLGESAAVRFVRTVFMRWLIGIPAFQSRFMAAMTGLDHPLDIGETKHAEEIGAHAKMAERHAH